MWRPKFKFSQRVQITGGFYIGRTGMAVSQRFHWKGLYNSYRVIGEADNENSYTFDAIIREKHLAPAPDKVMVVNAAGEPKEVK